MDIVSELSAQSELAQEVVKGWLSQQEEQPHLLSPGRAGVAGPEVATKANTAVYSKCHCWVPTQPSSEKSAASLEVR